MAPAKKRRKQDDGMWPDWLQPVFVREKGIHYTRIENSCSSGFPDLEVFVNGRAFYIELKVCDAPKRAGNKIQTNGKDWIRPEQVAWLRKRWAVGGNAFILLRVKRQWENVDLHYLIAGEYASWLRQRPSVENIRLKGIPILDPTDLLTVLHNTARWSKSLDSQSQPRP